MDIDSLLDLAGAVALLAKPALSARVTPSTGTFLDTNRLFERVVGRGSRVVSMNTDEMTTKVVLTAERPATIAVRASVGFEPIWVVSSHVRL
jgi:hypothetical protein